jgi:GWxTD domain-containing protein
MRDGARNPRGRAGVVPLLFLLAAAAAAGAGAASAAGPGGDDEDWSESPEASFLTREERADWKALDSRDSRDAFKERYWLIRDPSPGSAKNEFREMVLGRIRTADERFRIGKTPGSRSARGRAFVLFGTPARVRDERAAPLRDARIPQSIGDDRSPVGVVEGNETTSTWIYDRERTLPVVEAIGQPSFEIRFVVEPSRRTDRLQNPGLVHDFQERLARRSIVNPEGIPARDASPVRFASDALPHDALSPGARAVLDAAAGSARGAGGSFFGSAILWREAGDPETVIWFYLPASPGKKSFVGVVKPEGGGREAASFFETAAPSSDFSTGRPGEVVARTLRLPPGDYDGAFALLEESTGFPVASVATTLRVPRLEGPLAVSSVLVTRGPAPASGPGKSPFTIGPSRLPPRADAQFGVSESLWYFLEVAAPAEAGQVTLEPRVRHGTDTIGGLSAFPAGLREIAPGRFLCGFEMPLAGFSPGDYVLYVTVRDGGPGASAAVRRAEFRVVER